MTVIRRLDAMLEDSKAEKLGGKSVKKSTGLKIGNRSSERRGHSMRIDDFIGEVTEYDKKERF